MAEALEGLARLDEAERYARRALERAPANPRANLALGMVRMKQGRYAEARELLEKAAAVDPGSPKVHYQLSLAYARLDDRARSEEHLERYRQALDEVAQQAQEFEEAARRGDGG
jgi:tetratricopeptide (TPR) repeat protein